MKIVYHINDRKYFEHMLKQQKTSKKEAEKILNSMGKPLNVVYSLIKENDSLRYELRNTETNEKLNINDLNGYEKTYTNMCFKHFNSRNDKEIKEHCIDYEITQITEI